MKVFVGGLPWAVDNVRLKEVFQEFGPVVDARVIFDKDTGKSRGFGFVTFADSEDAEKLIAQGDVEVDGRTVRIDHANDNRQSRGQRNGQGGRGRDEHEPRIEERGRRRKERRRGRDSY